METVGMHPVVVHGGGAAITRAMSEAGINPVFVQGRRYTDDQSLDIVEKVLAGEVNRNLVDHVNELGGVAESLSFRTENVLFGEKLQLTDDEGHDVDLGHVGHVTHVDADTIRRLCEIMSCRSFRRCVLLVPARI